MSHEGPRGNADAIDEGLLPLPPALPRTWFGRLAGALGFARKAEVTALVRDRERIHRRLAEELAARPRREELVRLVARVEAIADDLAAAVDGRLVPLEEASREAAARLASAKSRLAVLEGQARELPATIDAKERSLAERLDAQALELAARVDGLKAGLEALQGDVARGDFAEGVRSHLTGLQEGYERLIRDAVERDGRIEAAAEAGRRLAAALDELERSQAALAESMSRGRLPPEG